MRVPSFIVAAVLLALTGCKIDFATAVPDCFPYCGESAYPLPPMVPTFEVTPVRVAGLPDSVVQVGAGGEHACALTAAGDVWCWGENAMRQTVGGLHTVDTPARVALDGVARIAVGGSHSCALTRSGAIWCWGFGYGTESCGTSPPLDQCRTAPVRIASERAFTLLTVGHDHACGISDGALWCWGNDVAGQLGRGTTSAAWIEPALALGGRRVTDASAGLFRTCAIAAEPYDVLCWGAFVGTATCSGPGYGGRCSPQPVSMSIAGLSEVRAGVSGGCGRTSPGDVVCWDAPGAEAPGRFQSLTVGHGHACGLSSDGTARCWGSNRVGQLGNGVATDTWTAQPQVVNGLMFVNLDAGFDSTCGVTATGQVYCWGDRFVHF